MLAFSPVSGSSNWQVLIAESTNNFSAPSSPFDVTATGHDTTGLTSNATVTTLHFCTNDDNTWALQGGGFTNPGGTAQFRNNPTGTEDNCISSCYRVQASPGATGDQTNRQTALGGDSGRWVMETYEEIPGGGASPKVARRRLSTRVGGLLVPG
jgi:hypothetical protein